MHKGGRSFVGKGRKDWRVMSIRGLLLYHNDNMLIVILTVIGVHEMHINTNLSCYMCE